MDFAEDEPLAPGVAALPGLVLAVELGHWYAEASERLRQCHSAKAPAAKVAPPHGASEPHYWLLLGLSKQLAAGSGGPHRPAVPPDEARQRKEYD